MTTTLTHEEARRALHAGRRWLDNKAAAALDAHLAACVECRAYAADLSVLEPAVTRALHARWDGVQPPTAPAAADTPARHPRPRRLKPAFGLAAVALLLTVAVVFLPSLVFQPADATPGPATQDDIVLPEATTGPVLSGALFVADNGTLRVDASSANTQVEEPPQVVAWQPQGDGVLWRTEVGLGPTLAIDAAGRYVFVLSRYRAGQESLRGLSFSAQELYPPNADWPTRMTVLDAATGQVAQTITLPEAPRAGQGEGWMKPIGAVGNRLYVYLLSSADSLAAIDLTTGTVLPERWTLCAGSYPRSVKLAPDGQTLYALCSPSLDAAGVAGQSNWWLQFTRPSDGPAAPASHRVALPFGGFASSRGDALLLAPDGTRLYVVDSRFGYVAEIDTATAQVLRRADYRADDIECQCPAILALSPSGGRLFVAAAGAEDTDAILWTIDTASLELLSRVQIPDGNVGPLTPQLLAPQAGQLYLRARGGMVVYDIESRATTTALIDQVFSPLQVAEYPVGALVRALPTPGPPAYLARSLFAADRGTFSGPPEATLIEAAPRVMAWDPISDQLLWSVETGREPQVAVDSTGSYVFVLSQVWVGGRPLTGQTFDFSRPGANPDDDWPLTLTVLDAATGTTAHSVTLPTDQGFMHIVGATVHQVFLQRFSSGTLAVVLLPEGTFIDGNIDANEPVCANAQANYTRMNADATSLFALCTPYNGGDWWVQIEHSYRPSAIRVDLPQLGSGTRWGNGLLLSHDGTRLYVADSLQGLLAEIDATTGAVLRTTRYSAAGRAARTEALMSLAPNGRVLYVTTREADPVAVSLFAFDTGTLSLVSQNSVMPAALHSMTAGPSDQLYVASDKGVSAYTLGSSEWRFPTGQLPASITQLVPYPANVPVVVDYPLPNLPTGLGLIAFERDGDIHVIKADGTGDRNLTQRPGPDRAPTWSPDGRYLAYLAGRGDATDVMLLDVEAALASADAVPPVSLIGYSASLVLSDHLAWSPDGQFLAVTFWPRLGTGTNGSQMQLLDVPAALSGNGQPAPPLPHLGSDPRFSPDGTRLLYLGSDESGVPALFVETLATGERVNITAGESASPENYRAYNGYDWSPDGQTIAYLSAGPWRGRWPDSMLALESEARLVFALPDGTSRQTVSTLRPAPNGLRGLRYSPDGRALMYISDHSNGGCWLVHVQFLDVPSHHSGVGGVCHTMRTALPDWSPDSRWLVLTAGWTSAGPAPDGNNGHALELTALDVFQARYTLDTEPRVIPTRLTTWVGDDLSPRWQP